MTLGTAQLGLKYGIANKTGKPDLKSANQILESAVKNGINSFDTAPGYGNSEEIIGSFVKKLPINESFISTKIPKVQQSKDSTLQETYDNIKSVISSSQRRLNLEQIPICLLHEAIDMTDYDGNVTKSLLRLRDEGIVDKIGVSVYHPDEVLQFLKIDAFDVIQIPINLFDLRLIKQGLLNDLIQRDTIVFARSIFLQGLFFLENDKIPPHLHLAKKPLADLNKLSQDIGKDIATIALTFVRDLSGITSLVIGTETENQLIEDIKLMNLPPLSSDVSDKILEMFCEMPEELINPSLWNKKE